MQFGRDTVMEWIRYFRTLTRVKISALAALFCRTGIVLRSCPLEVLCPSYPFGFAVDIAVKLNSDTVFIMGWLFDVADTPKSLRPLSSSGLGPNILEKLHRFERKDIAAYYGKRGADNRSGFLGTLSHKKIGDHPSGLLITSPSVGTIAVRLSHADKLPPVQAWDIFIQNLPHPDTVAGIEEFVKRHIVPAVAAIEDSIAQEPVALQARDIGKNPDNPKGTIILHHLEHRDYIEHSIAQLVTDPKVNRWEILLLLRKDDTFGADLEKLYNIYGLPLRLLSYADDFDLASILNKASSFARSDTLFFSSTATIDEGGHSLFSMFDLLRSNKKIKAVGPLLFDMEGTFLNAGFHFENNKSDLWDIVPCIGAGEEPQAVHALSHHCLLIERKAFETSGGFRNLFGSLDEYGLCLSIAENGGEMWVDPTASFRLPIHELSPRCPDGRGRIHSDYIRYLK